MKLYTVNQTKNGEIRKYDPAIWSGFAKQWTIQSKTQYFEIKELNVIRFRVRGTSAESQQRLKLYPIDLDRKNCADTAGRLCVGILKTSRRFICCINIYILNKNSVNIRRYGLPLPSVVSILDKHKQSKLIENVLIWALACSLWIGLSDCSQCTIM